MQGRVTVLLRHNRDYCVINPYGDNGYNVVTYCKPAAAATTIALSHESATSINWWKRDCFVTQDNTSAWERYVHIEREWTRQK